MQDLIHPELELKEEQFYNPDDFKKYLDMAGVMFLVLDSEEKITMINKKGCEILGYEENEIIGKNWFDNFVPKSERESVKLFFKELMQGKEPDEFFVNSIVRKNGDEKIIYWHTSLLHDKSGKIKGVLSSGEDITEIRKIQYELKRRSELMESLYTLSRELGIAETLNDMLTQIGEVIKRNSSVLAGAIYLFNIESGEFQLSNHFGDDSLINNLPEQMLKSETFVKNVLEHNTGYRDEVPASKNKISSHLKRFSVPMYTGNELMGLIISLVKSYDEYDLEFIKLAANETGRGIKRKKAEIAQKQSDERFYTVFQTSPDSISISDLEEGTFLEVNERFTEMTGYTSEEIVGEKVTQIEGWEYPEDREKLIKELKMSSKVSNFETTLRRKDGVFNVLMSAKIIDYNGRKCMLSLVKDITDRIKSEKEILAAKEKLEKITNTSPAFISLFDIKNDKTIYSNKSILKSVGYTDEDVKRIAATPPDDRNYVYHPDDVKIIQEADKKTLELKDDEVYTLEFRLKDKNGKYYWFRHSTAVYQRDNEGIPTHSINIFENISDQKKAEEELRKVTLAVEQSPAVVMITDKGGKIEYVNPKFTLLTGYTFKEVLGKDPNILKSGLTPNIVYTAMWETILSGKVWKGELCNKKKSGELFWENATISPILDENENINHFLAVKEDITDRKKAEEMINKRNNEIQLLYEAGKKLSSTLDLNELYDSMYDTISKVSDCDELFVSTYDDETKLITYFYLRSRHSYQRVDVSKIPSIPLAPPGYGILSEAIHTGKSKIIDDYQESFKKVKTTYVIDEKGDVLEPNKRDEDNAPNSALIVPIKLDSKVFGVVQIFSRKKKAFTSDQLNFVESLMYLVALANNNAILYKKAQDEISERQKAEQEISKSLKDKELLLREIHHRVKNNLAVISSLLYLQSKKSQNKEVLYALLESQQRIKAMVLVHEKLYKSKDFSSINYAEYLQSLTTTLFRSYGSDSERMKLKFDVEDLYLDTDSATNLGLIINELVSNSIKHAFTEGQEGNISISMNLDNSGIYTLTVCDDGKGLPPGFDINEVDTLGLKLVSTLVEQLEGSLEVENGAGTCFKIKFQKRS